MTGDKIEKTDPDNPYCRVLSASTLMGDRVRNAAGEDLGKVNDLMIELQSGRIVYAVLSVGGVLGLGGKLVAVSWNALRVDEDEKELILDIEKQRLYERAGVRQGSLAGHG